MMYLKLVLACLWLVLCSVVGLVASVILWGNTNLNRWFAHLFSWGALKISGIELEIEGLERLESRKPCIYVANHQSGVDMMTFGAIYPRHTVVVGKKELLYLPFFGLFFKAAGNIVLNRAKRVSAIAGLKAASDDIRRRHVSVWIFPEGTRNRTEDPMMPFKKGAFYMALQAGVPIVPVVCAPLKDLIDWKHKRARGGKVRLRVLPPIETTGRSAEGDVDKLARETHDRMLEALLSLSGPSSMTTFGGSTNSTRPARGAIAPAGAGLGSTQGR